MSKRRIVTIGLQLASDDCAYEPFSSKASLLDWDIVLFRPNIRQFTHPCYDHYRGKLSLDDRRSFQLRECCEHWRRELKQALEAGKTIIVFLAPLIELFIDSGKRTQSGTGRNRQITRLVEEYSNYHSLPYSLTAVVREGAGMKLVPEYCELLSSFWNDFESISRYAVTFSPVKRLACIVTQSGNHAVGALFRDESSNGSILLWPDIDFLPHGFQVLESGDPVDADSDLVEIEDIYWSEEAFQFATKMIASVVALDKALRSCGEVSPEPAWVQMPVYDLHHESELRAELIEAEKKLESVQREKECVSEQLKSAGRLRGLLFEKGKALERVVIEALVLLGFRADGFKEGNSEFDVVFESEEGRLIGEVEGKDNRAVSVDKLRQLGMNIQEDLARESVSVQAKPVLFGNGFRVQKVEMREEPFTAKCVAAAEANGTALVFTPDLFLVCQFLVANSDAEFAAECRQAMLAARGRVAFPSVPKKGNGDECDGDASIAEG